MEKKVKMLEERIIEVDLLEYEQLCRKSFQLDDFTSPKYELLDMIEFETENWSDNGDPLISNIGLITAAFWNKIGRTFVYTIQYIPCHNTVFTSTELTEEKIKGKA